MKKLSFSIDIVDRNDVISLNGPIFEGCGKILKPLIDTCSINCIFNFRNVTHTNTCGVAEWMEFLQSFVKNRNIVFVEVPPSVVMLINMIPLFRSGAEIKSVYRSYFCRNCQDEQWDLMEQGVNMPDPKLIQAGSDVLSLSRCRKCNHDITAEVSAEEFFGFLLTNEQ